MTYQLSKADPISGSQVIIRMDDGACIPMSEANSDYQAFLAWVAEGNQPEEAQP